LLHGENGRCRRATQARYVLSQSRFGVNPVINFEVILFLQPLPKLH
jgi:hypothetical protein